MLIASTLASAAMGARHPIGRDRPRHGAGAAAAARRPRCGSTPAPNCRSSSAAQVNAVMSDAAASDDSDLRNIVHCGTPLTATALALAEHNGGERRGRAGRDRARLRSSPDASSTRCRIRASAASTARRARSSRRPGRRRGCCGSTPSRRRTRSRCRDLGRRAGEGRRYQRRARVPCRHRDDCSASRRREAAQRGYTCEERILEMKLGLFEAFGGVDGAAAARLATRDLGALLGHRHRHGGKAGARRASLPRAGRGRRQCGARGQYPRRRRSRASPCRGPA